MTWDFINGRIAGLPTPSGRMPDLTRALAFRDLMKRNLVAGLNRPKDSPSTVTGDAK